MSERDPESIPQPASQAGGANGAESIAGELAARLDAPAGGGQETMDWAALAAGYEREARAIGQDPAAARLLFQIGRIYEERLKNPRSALTYYQNAHALNPKLLPNLAAAERLAAEVGNWGLVAELLELHAQAVGDPREAGQLRFERARIFDERLGRGAEARRIWLECAERDPQNLGVAEHLAGLAAAEGSPQDLADAWLRCAVAVEDEALRAHYLAAAADVTEDRLAKPDLAADLYRKAFLLHRKDAAIRAAARRHAERQGRWEDVVETLRAEAEDAIASGSARAGAIAFYALAKVYSDKLNRGDEAVIALLEARKLVADDALVLGELARLYDARSQWDALAEVLKARAAALGSRAAGAAPGGEGQERIAILLRLAEVYEEKLKNVTEAILCYAEVIKASPSHRSAVSALGRLYARTGNWEGVLDTFIAELAVATDPREKAQKAFKAGEILEERLSKIPEAIERYRETLKLQPGYLPAQKALERLYEKAGRWADLVEVLEQDLEETRQLDQKVALLSRIARIHEERLSSLAKAAECYQRILDVAPEHLFAIRSLAAIYERQNQWRELLILNEREAQLTDDQRQVVSLLHKNCEILEDHLGDEQGAADAYQKVLTLNPTYLPALKALGRLYFKAERWVDLIAMYRAEAEVQPSTDVAANLVFKIGELYEQHLGGEDEAIAAYREVLTLSPSHFAALRSLSRVYRSRADWENLIEILRGEAAARVDPAEQATALFQVAEIWEEKLHNAEAAAEVYEEVARLIAGFPPAVRALERLYPSLGRWQELFALRQEEARTTEGSARCAALLRLARLALDRLDDAAAAKKACEEALALEPANAGALLMLERMSSSAKDPAGRAEVRDRLAARCADHRAAAGLWVNAGLDRIKAGGDGAEEFQKALGLDPASVVAAVSTERALRAAGEPRALAAFFESRAAAAGDADAKAAHALFAGEAWERAGDPDRALSAFNSALSADAVNLPALRAARRVYAARGDWAAVRAALQAEGSAARDAATAVAAWLEAGEIAENRFADTDGATLDYRKALEKDPLDARASKKLEDILAAKGGAADLCALKEARAMAQRDRGTAAGEWMAAARIALDQLSDVERATRDLDKGLALRPDWPEALEMRAGLALRGNRFADAARDLAARIQLGGEPAALVPANVSLGGLYQDHLADPARAVAHLSAALAVEPERVEALTRLARIHREAQNWPAASDALKRLLALPQLPSADQIEHALALADVLEQGFDDSQGAIALCKRAFELSPGNAAALQRLARLYEKAGNLQSLAEVLEQSAGLAPDKAAQVEIRVRAAKIFAETVRDRAKAIAQYRAALELDPTREEARAALAELYSTDNESSALAVEEHRRLLAADPFRLASWHALYKLFEAQKAHDRAYVVASVLFWLKDADDRSEGFFYSEVRNRAPAETAERLDAVDWANLCHPSDRGPQHEAMFAIGDQLEKVVPTELGNYEVGRGDRLKGDHPVRKLCDQLARNLGFEEDYELYLAKKDRYLLAIEPTEPISLVVGQDVIRKWHAREQRFLLGRLAARLRAKSAAALKVDARKLGEIVAAAVRQWVPGYSGSGRPDDDLAKRVGKALSRKARNALKDAATALGAQRGPLDMAAWTAGMACTADRAGMLLSNDVAASLNLLLREDPSAGSAKLDTAQQIVAVARERQDLRALLLFAVSDDYFRLRQKLKLAVA